MTVAASDQPSRSPPSTTDYLPGATPPAESGSAVTASAASGPAPVTRVRRMTFDQSASTRLADQAGIAYFLPRQLATVTVTRSEATLDEAIEQLGEAELDVSVAKARLAAARSALKDSQDLLIDNGDNATIRDLLVARINEQQAVLAKAEVAASKADSKRAAKGDALKAGASPGGAHLYKVAIEIALLAPDADPRHGYRLNPRHSAFRDDKHKFDVSANGLLQSTDIVAADRTADILVELATFAGAVSGARAAMESETCTPQPELSAVVDLADADSVADLNAIIQCLGVRLEPVGPASVGQEPMSGSIQASAQGIFYRTPVALLVRIRKCVFGADGVCDRAKAWPIAQIIAVSLPQAGPISYVTQNAGLMTTTHYNLAFKDGILTTYDATRPSELLEVARTPMRLVNGFFDGASKIVSIRTGQSNAAATLVQSQTALQAAQLNARTSASAAELTLLREQAKRDAINRCIGEHVTRGEPIDSCLAGP